MTNDKHLSLNPVPVLQRCLGIPGKEDLSVNVAATYRPGTLVLGIVSSEVREPALQAARIASSEVPEPLSARFAAQVVLTDTEIFPQGTSMMIIPAPDATVSAQLCTKNTPMTTEMREILGFVLKSYGQKELPIHKIAGEGTDTAIA